MKKILSVMLALLLMLSCCAFFAPRPAEASLESDLAAARKKLEEAEKRVAQLQKQIEEAKKRSEEVKAYEEYVKTDEYIKDIAEEKLGLVDPNEIIFKPRQ